MRQISLKQGIGLFLAIFILPAIVLMPFRAELMALVGTPAWLSAMNNLLGAAIITGLAVYAWNQRKRIQELEREVERERYRRENAVTDGGQPDE